MRHCYLIFFFDLSLEFVPLFDNGVASRTANFKLLNPLILSHDFVKLNHLKSMAKVLIYKLKDA